MAKAAQLCHLLGTNEFCMFNGQIIVCETHFNKAAQKESHLSETQTATLTDERRRCLQIATK